MRRAGGAWLGALALSPLVFFWPGTSGRVLLGDGDAFVQFLPYWSYVAEQWAAFSPPFWAPQIAAGYPLLAEPQAGVFNPLRLLFVVLSAPVALNATVLLYAAVAAVSTFLLARREGLAPPAAALAGAVFCYSGFLIGHQAITALYATICCFPLAFLAIRCCADRPGYRTLAGVGAAVVALVLAGHPQFLFHALFFGLFYAAWLTWRVDPERRLRFLVCVAGGLLLGAALSAPQLLPTRELAALSSRSELAYTDFAGTAIPAASLPAALLSPALYGLFPGDGAEGMIHVGLAVLILAGFGCLLHRTSLIWIGLAVFGALLYLGDSTPLYRLMYQVPGYSLFRLASRNGLVVDFALAMLAGWGLEWILRRPAPKRAALAAVAVLAVGFVCQWWLHDAVHARLVPAVLERGDVLGWDSELAVAQLQAVAPELAALAVGVAAWVFLLARGGGPLLMAAMLVLTASHLWRYRHLNYVAPMSEVRAALQAPLLLPVPEELSEWRVVWAGPTGWLELLNADPDGWRQRYVSWGGSDVNLLKGVASVSGYGPLLLRDYRQLAGGMRVAGQVTDPGFYTGPGARLLNVGYAIVSTDTVSPLPPVFQEEWELLEERGPDRLYRRPGPNAFAWAVDRLEDVSEEEVWSRLEQIDVDSVALTTDGSSSLEEFGRPRELGVARVAGNRVEVELESVEECFLVLSQTWYPGWRAWADGRRVALRKVNGALTGVRVPAGARRLELRYVPEGFWLGVALAATAALVFWLARRLDVLGVRTRPPAATGPAR